MIKTVTASTARSWEKWLYVIVGLVPLFSGILGTGHLLLGSARRPLAVDRLAVLDAGSGAFFTMVIFTFVMTWKAGPQPSEQGRAALVDRLLGHGLLRRGRLGASCIRCRR